MGTILSNWKPQNLTKKSARFNDTKILKVYGFAVNTVPYLLVWYLTQKPLSTGCLGVALNNAIIREYSSRRTFLCTNYYFVG
jgi:hypothetical protein